jgi:bifunctional UDP-N-acetylglucosamine pyrophosphorylase/glucosamine-1-phosphate N-acetyltransferase
MSGDSEDSGESSIDRSCRCGEVRVLAATVRAAFDSGVKFQDPFAVYIGPEVVFERDAWVGAGSHILGKSWIGSGASIGPNSIVEDSMIGNDVAVQSFATVSHGSEIRSGAQIKSRSEVRSSTIAGDAEIGPNALVEDSRIAAKAKVGPFCRVRAGSDIDVEAYIGTQAEIKASRIGPGAKVGHFSFLGDAEIGAAVNIGAGSITANFDGRSVQQTIIEDGVSIGAGCVLVAPIRLGRKSRTGAGAVVTRDVPDGELVLGVPARARNMRSLAV